MSVSALIVYPAEGANSFISLEDANTVIEDQLNYETWASLDDEDKTRRLLTIYKKFYLLVDFVPPDGEVDCLGEAQAIAALYTLQYDTLNFEPSQQTRVEKLGPLYSEYFKNTALDRLSVDDYPEEVWACLTTWGAQRTSIDGVGTFYKPR